MLKISYEEVKFNNEVILEKQSIEFDKGVTVLVGENGTGKSSILNMLYMLNLEFNPQIFIDDSLISEIDTSDYRNTYITYISQSNVLFSNQTVKDSLQLIVGEYDQLQLEKLLTVLSFNDVFKRNPKVNKLSGGEKQKLKIICGLLTDTPVVLLDEPMNNLDAQSIERLNKYITADNRYFILTSHIDLGGEYQRYCIESKKVSFSKVENYHQYYELKPAKSLSDQSLKSLRKTNFKSRSTLYFINMIVVVVLLLALANTSEVYRIATIDRSNFVFGDKATLIKAPIGNDVFLTFGKEEWLENIPTYFSDDDINRLKSLDYVKSVIPVKSDGYGMNGIDYKNKYILDVQADDAEYTFSSALYPKQVATNLPSQNYETNAGYIESFIVGTFPDDDSNQAIIDVNTADYIISKTDYSSYQQLVGKTITVPVIERDKPSEKTKLDFEVTGVFQPKESIDKREIKGTIVPGFYVDNRFVQSTYTQFQSVDEIYGRIKETLTLANIDPSVISIDDIPSPAYDALYIETNTTEDVEKLTEEIRSYDQYTEIENNYVYSQSVNFKYLTKVIRNNIILTIIFVLMFIYILVLLFRMYKSRLEVNVYTLYFYAYSTSEQQRFLDYEIKEYLLTVAVINLIVSLVIQFMKLDNYSLVLLLGTNFALFIANYVILKIVLRKGKK